MRHYLVISNLGDGFVVHGIYDTLAAAQSSVENPEDGNREDTHVLMSDIEVWQGDKIVERYQRINPRVRPFAWYIAE